MLSIGLACKENTYIILIFKNIFTYNNFFIFEIHPEIVQLLNLICYVLNN